MGEAARRHYLRGTTPTERLDAGIRLWLRTVQAEVDKIPVPPDATPQEAARIRFQALRRRHA